MIYMVALYVSILIAAVLKPDLKRRMNYSGHDIWPVLALVLLLMLAVKIPFVGWILGLIILSFGLGSILKTLSAKSSTEV